MLTTFSGIVGSGKSTNAKHALRLLQDLEYPVLYLRFRFLIWRKIFQPLPVVKKGDASAPSQKKAAKISAEENLRQQAVRTLTLWRALGYAWRILGFRFFFALRLRRKIVVLDRFYYDNFVHYEFSGARERFYLTMLQHLMPRPDLALFFIATPHTILQRRPHYEAEYVRQLHQQYCKVAKEFPHLIVIPTDSFAGLTEKVTQHVRRVVAGS